MLCNNSTTKIFFCVQKIIFCIYTQKHFIFYNCITFMQKALHTAPQATPKWTFTTEHEHACHTKKTTLPHNKGLWHSFYFKSDINLSIIR